jgi:methyl-accepting chemotaxis protein
MLLPDFFRIDGYADNEKGSTCIMAKIKENWQASQPLEKEKPREKGNAEKVTEAASKTDSSASAVAVADAPKAKEPAGDKAKTVLHGFSAAFSKFAQSVTKSSGQSVSERKKPDAGDDEVAQKSLSSIISTCCVLAIIVVSAAVLVIMLVMTTSAAHSVAVSAASTSMKVMEQEYNAQGSLLSSTCAGLASDSHVTDLLSGQAETINDTNWKTYCLFHNYYNTVLFDNTGKVLASGVPNFKRGSDISTNGCVAQALATGEAAYQTKAEEGFNYALEAAAPVLSNSKAIGGILIVRDFTEIDFVDSLKQMTGDDYTVFAGNVRLCTTLTDDSGASTAGTEMPADIAKKVLEKGETYSGSLKLNGINYITIYEPIKDMNGDVTGALFTGYNLNYYNTRVYRSIALGIAVVIVMVLLEVVLLRRLLDRRLRKPLEQIVVSVNDVAQGRMDEETSARLNALRTNDEIGQLARSMESAVASIRQIAQDTVYLQDALTKNDLTAVVDVEHYKGIYQSIANVLNKLFAEIALNMKQIRQVSTGINDRTCQVSAAAESLAQGSTEQASSVEELASTISQIVTRVNQNATDAENASAVSQAAAEDVSQSSEQMTAMINAMNEISETSAQIGSIVKTIDDLAFQTSILALNAAVEAAHAGSQGRGFAVVASEVKNLASKSAAAAKDSAVLIQNVQKAIQKGSDSAGSVEHSLQNIIGNTTKVNDVVLEISTAASEQVKMLSQISTGIDQISAVVQSNTGIAEETAATSQGLTLDTEKLNGMVNKYKFN